MSISGNHQCPDWVDFPINARNTHSGLLGTSQIICGGQPGGKTCYTVTRRGYKKLGTMFTARIQATSVTISNSRLWISGGVDEYYFFHSSSEFLQVNGSFQG